jgi:hypothetical protein
MSYHHFLTQATSLHTLTSFRFTSLSLKFIMNPEDANASMLGAGHRVLLFRYRSYRQDIDSCSGNDVS